MTPILFLLWIILCSRISFDAGMLQIIIVGILITALIRFFMYKALDLGLRAELLFYKRIGYVLLYVCLLVSEVLKANFAVIRILTRPPDTIHPVIVKIRVPLKDDLARTLLSCGITLTPGTITIDTEKDIYTIHCLDASLGEGIENSSFVSLLKRLDRSMLGKTKTSAVPTPENPPHTDADTAIRPGTSSIDSEDSDDSGNSGKGDHHNA